MPSRTATMLLCICVPLQLASAQSHDLPFRRFSLRDGLSQSSVNAIVQDQQGFIWFGTQDGLNRFDGHTVQVYNPDPSVSTTLSNGYIWKLLVARNGDLWIGTYSGGLNRFNPRTEQFSSYRIIPDSAAAQSSSNVTALCEDSNGTLWVGTWGGGIARAVKDSADALHFVQHVHTPGDPASLVDNRIADIHEDPRGNLWVATWGGISCLRRERRGTGAFESYRHQTDDNLSLSDDHVWTIAVDRSGDIWFGTWGGGLCKYRGGTFLRYLHARHSPHDPGSNSITALCTGNGGALWVGTSDAGLSRYDPDRDTFTQLRHDPYNPESIGGNGILSLLEDRSGSLWVGHEGAGVSQYDPHRNRFLHYRHIAGVPGSLAHDNVRAFATDGEGGIWVGMRGGGVDHLARGASEFVHYRQGTAVPSGLSDNLVLSLLVRRTGDVFIGTQHGGLNVLQRDSGRIVHYVHRERDTRSVASNSISALFEDSRGTVWVGTNGGGLDRFDSQSNGFVHYTRPDTGGTEVNALSIWTINQDRSGALWIGTWGMGLFRFDVQTGTVARFAQKEGDTSSLGNNTVFAVAEDSAGFLWVGTEGGGLNRLDPRTGKFMRFSQRDGLPNNTIYGILPDQEGKLWLSTNRGLARLDPRTRQIRVYDSRDGLQEDEFNQNAYCRLTDGRLLFGGIGGFNVIRPDSILPDSPPPAVVLTDVKVLGISLQMPQAALPALQVVLRYGQDILSFEFVALDYVTPEKDRYTYMLEGFDRNWIESGRRRFATYTSLPGGDYVFRVRGSNGDGVWNLTGASIALRVVPPFWETWWFRVLVVLGCVVLVVILYESRIHRLLEIERMRTHIASDLHDDIGSRLTRIAIQSEIIQNTDDAAAIRSASSRIGSASREIIRTMSDVIWSIDARNDTWGDLVRKMRDCAAELFEGTSIEVSIDQKGCDLKRKIPVDVRQNLYLIFKEALNNARRHSRAHHVTVSLVQADGRLSMEVADDGHGLEPHASQAGQGFRNMRMRANRIHAELNIIERPGLRVVLTMKAISS